MNNPSNYRSISLCDTSSELYSTIINNRLREWVEQNNITAEYQSGFKRGYSTIDHMFILLTEICYGLFCSRMVSKESYLDVLEVCIVM